MPILILDTGFLYSLVVDSTYSEAARSHWQHEQLWVPAAVHDEIRYRAKDPQRTRQLLPDLPPELPRHAQGLLASTKWSNIQIIDLDDAETTAASVLAAQIGGKGGDNSGEAAAAVLATTRAVGAVVAIDDQACLPVLNSYVTRKTGSGLSYVTTTQVLDGLVDNQELTAEQRQEIAATLAKKKRPFT